MGNMFIGAEVIDRTLRDGNFKADSMLKVLRSGKNWDWSNRGEFRGLSGRGGAVTMRDKVAAEFPDEKGVSVKELFKQIMQELASVSDHHGTIHIGKDVIERVRRPAYLDVTGAKPILENSP